MQSNANTTGLAENLCGAAFPRLSPHLKRSFGISISEAQAATPKSLLSLRVSYYFISECRSLLSYHFPRRIGWEQRPSLLRRAPINSRSGYLVGLILLTFVFSQFARQKLKSRRRIDGWCRRLRNETWARSSLSSLAHTFGLDQEAELPARLLT